MLLVVGMNIVFVSEVVAQHSYILDYASCGDGNFPLNANGMFDNCRICIEDEGVFKSSSIFVEERSSAWKIGARHRNVIKLPKPIGIIKQSPVHSIWIHILQTCATLLIVS
jgi:hypothetical protein